LVDSIRDAALSVHISNYEARAISILNVQFIDVPWSHLRFCAGELRFEPDCIRKKRARPELGDELTTENTREKTGAGTVELPKFVVFSSHHNRPIVWRSLG
jgi:hypothetical protein